MMKYLFLIMTLLITHHAYCQFDEKTTEKIKVNYYKKLPLFPGVVDHKNGNYHTYLDKNKNIINFYQDSSSITIKVSKENDAYQTVKVYASNTKLLQRKFVNFYDFCTGETKKYDEKGVLIEKQNCDINYAFSVDQLIEKVKKDYLIDLKTMPLGVSVSRTFYESKHCYSVNQKFGTAKTPSRIIIFDGTTGAVLSDTVKPYNESNDPRI